MNEEIQPVATLRLWCCVDGDFFDFTITIDIPRKEDASWFCNWSLGELNKFLPDILDPSEGVNSFQALSFALRRIPLALNLISNGGGKFYFDEEAKDKISDLEVLFYFPGK